jgi:class 3 adenylate cyclase/tetratricopeptide (TPR) repeat protein
VPETRKTVTIVFADVTGSTGLGEQLDPESLRGVMQRYFEEMQGALERHGGTVEKFIGDAIMAVFGIPRVHEDDAVRAVRAAAEMRERLGALNEELERDWGVRLEMRIGLNSGEVVAGDPAGGQSFATGDTVNVAARLEQAAEPGEILLGEATYALVRDAVEVGEREELGLRGKTEPRGARRLRAVKPGLPGHVRRLDAPMIGRERELALLEQAYERAVQEQSGHLFTVLGAAGIGKSRLLGEFVSRLPSVTRVARGRCLPYGEGITYWPVAEAVKDLAAISDDQSVEDAHQRLIGLLAGNDDAEIVAAKVGAAIGLAHGAAATAEASWAVRRLFEGIARDRPLVVVFDDIQWGEATFLDLVEQVVDWSRDAPILVVCLARPELLDVRPGWGGGKPNATSVLLEQLPGEECALLVGSLLGEGELEEDARERIVERAGGNPLFVEEMLAMLLDAGMLERENGRWLLVGDVGSVAIPATIQALLAARLDRLLPAERSVIERGAVEGEVFHSAAVSELLGDAGPATPYLQTLVRKELLRPARGSLGADDAFRFRHLLIRDAAYTSIPKGVRADLHRRFAEWLERAAGERLVEYEEILGYHLEQSYRYRRELGHGPDALGDVAEKAAGWLASAGRRAAGRGDMPAAANLLERAAELLPEDDPRRSEIDLVLGWALTQAGEFARAETIFDGVIVAARARGDRRIELRGLVERMDVVNMVRPEGAALETFRLVEEVVPELEAMGDDRGLAHLWRVDAYAQNTLCRYGPTVESLERGLVHAERAGDDVIRSEILTWLPTRLARGPIPAGSALRRCRELLGQASGDRPAEAGALAGIALLEGIRGNFEEARAAKAESNAILNELGLALLLAVGGIWGGEIEMLAGDFAAAERLLRAAADFLDARAERSFYPTAAVLLARALLQQGHVDEAWENLKAGEAATASDDMFTIVGAHAVRTRLLGVAGRTVEAEESGRKAVDLALQSDDLSLQAEAFLDLAGVLGDGSAKAEALTGALEVAERKENVVLAGQARARLAELRE